jgi:hypothetical protein
MYRLPHELIVYIYSFDPTCHDLYKKCVLEIKRKLVYRKEKIRSINYRFWNGYMPESVYEYHKTRMSLVSANKWYDNPSGISNTFSLTDSFFKEESPVV